MVPCRFSLNLPLFGLAPFLLSRSNLWLSFNSIGLLYFIGPSTFGLSKVTLSILASCSALPTSLHMTPPLYLLLPYDPFVLVPFPSFSSLFVVSILSMSLQIHYVFWVFFTVCMCLDNLRAYERSLDYLQLFFGFLYCVMHVKCTPRLKFKSITIKCGCNSLVSAC